MACTNREKETDWDTFFFEKNLKKKLSPAKKIKKIKKMPCYQGTGLGCPVALLAGFPSKQKAGLVWLSLNQQLYVST